MTAAIDLELYRHRFAAIAEEMGEVLTRAAFSPNIKERRDHSCALFDEHGDMVAQAAHIPVHLGAAPLCVKAVIESLGVEPGRTAIVNDPFAGGTHLPDITLVTAVDLGDGGPAWFVATRAHHADVGGITPGSLPPSRTIDDEGWRTPPVWLDDAIVADLLATSRTPDERRGDLAAQRAANALGARRLVELVDRGGAPLIRQMGAALLAYTERRMAAALATWPAGAVTVEDVLDDARGSGPHIPIRLTLTLDGAGRATFDLRASGDQVEGPMNAVRAITDSAVFYVLHLLAGADVPANSGVMRCVDVQTRPGSVVDAVAPAAVAAGNVETSQRLVDVLLQAFAAVQPDRIPACSYGSMNNVLIGSVDGAASPWVVYETHGGGHGAGSDGAGASAMQAHMTNTWNTPIEALEHAWPLRIERYAVRRGSGGAGRHAGGDGLVRVWRLLEPAVVTIIAERRRIPPPGAAGGEPGATGQQWIERDGAREPRPGKFSERLDAGTVVGVETPGGGGWGTPVATPKGAC